mmetsp:Transcript_147616/g.258085  ORF Transcript_147616/g.258085 Transcript_147616/m.258085 type:complete len:226 (+) Transcript_147616:154-831(+)
MAVVEIPCQNVFLLQVHQTDQRNGLLNASRGVRAGRAEGHGLHILHQQPHCVLMGHADLEWRGQAGPGQAEEETIAEDPAPWVHRAGELARQAGRGPGLQAVQLWAAMCLLELDLRGQDLELDVERHGGHVVVELFRHQHLKLLLAGCAEVSRPRHPADGLHEVYGEVHVNAQDGSPQLPLGVVLNKTQDLFLVPVSLHVCEEHDPVGGSGLQTIVLGGGQFESA